MLWRFKAVRLVRLRTVRDRTGELVVAEVELRQLGQVAQLCRDRTGELVVAEVELRQLGQVAQLCRDRTGEFVVVQGKLD